MPSSIQACLPSSTFSASLYLRTSSFDHRSWNRRTTLRRELRQKRSASSAALAASVWPCSDMAWARVTDAAMANSSAPTSTSRNSTDWRCSSFGPKRSIAWNALRARRRDARSTKRTCGASVPNAPYLGQKPQPIQRLGYHQP